MIDYYSEYCEACGSFNVKENRCKVFTCIYNNDCDLFEDPQDFNMWECEECNGCGICEDTGDDL